jgi:hypothetical protein
MSRLGSIISPKRNAQPAWHPSGPWIRSRKWSYVDFSIHWAIDTGYTGGTFPEHPISSYRGTGALSLLMVASGTCTAVNVVKALREQTQSSGEQKGRRPGFVIGATLPRFAGQVGGYSLFGNAKRAIMPTLRNVLSHSSRAGV